MAAKPYRERHYACIHPETYKYFLAREQVEPVWQRLAQVYGKPRIIRGFGVREIQAKRLILRSTAGGNPITVIRKRACTIDDVAALHELIGFHDDSQGE